MQFIKFGQILEKKTIVPCQSDRKEVSFEWLFELKSYNQHSQTSIILSGREKGQRITRDNSRSQTAPLNQMPYTIPNVS